MVDCYIDVATVVSGIVNRLYLMSLHCYVQLGSGESSVLLLLFDNSEPLQFLDLIAYTGKREIL